MSSKFKICALAMAVAGAASALSGCGMINYYWQYYDKEVDSSLREPTGYYEHAQASEQADPLVVPAGLQNPQTDPVLSLPDYPANAYVGPVGEEVDVRPPQAAIRSSEGVQAYWQDGEAIVWLNSNGVLVQDESEAWEILQRVLRRLYIETGQVTPGAYELTTMAADFNEFGTPYTAINDAQDNLRYRQIYRLRVGRDSSGNIGIACSLVGSMTLLRYGVMLTDILTPAELQRFAMGFANQIIREVSKVNQVAETMPDEVVITLDRDNNRQDCIRVNAPYESVFNAMRSMLPQYGFEVTEYSISHSSFKVTYDEQDSSFFRERGVEDFMLEDGEYIIRVAVDASGTVITFYDDDDKPLRTNIITRLYPGFSEALLKELTWTR